MRRRVCIRRKRLKEVLGQSLRTVVGEPRRGRELVHAPASPSRVGTSQSSISPKTDHAGRADDEPATARTSFADGLKVRPYA